MPKYIVFFVSSLFMFAFYQSCGELESRNNYKISSVGDNQANVDFLVNDNQEDVLLRVPSDLIESASVNEGFNWVFVDEDGEEFPINNNGTTLRLSDLSLDLDLLANGFFRVRFVSQSIVQIIILKIIIQGADEELPIDPVIGLPPRPDQPGPVVGLPPMPDHPMPVVGLPPRPDHPGPVIGLPPRPDHPQPVIGLPPRPVHPGPVIGLPPLPDQPVVGLRLPDGEMVVGLPPRPHEPVIGLVVPKDKKIIGLPAQ